MEKNEGTVDRVIRVILGAALIVGGSFASSWVAWLLWIVGIVSLITGLAGSCGIYKIFGINTCKVKKEE